MTQVTHLSRHLRCGARRGRRSAASRLTGGTELDELRFGLP